ncbi:cell division protein ZapC domain-containing protein [Rheinheimera sp. MMS21-TC3]|uniref:cell division protein ZapC domain-containing protein n=1 Tax=Rheinheimera sp. MMS21-TC3 TaxID=3072790 RepID=UPI0028C506C0|nr:cell division protein ZapC domain-containing protein [Rheinheimera sp. MMS21-TC3]WNO60959.1 cell division protein ZapC [Rheinheimera sp. MMS21-TC3]
MLTPSECWQWNYCQQRDRLLLDLNDELQFCSPFSAAQLVAKPMQQALSITEAEAFWAIDHSLQSIELSDAVRFELCLTGLSCAFLPLLAHKSWHFQQASAHVVALYSVVVLRGMSTQHALVVATDQESSTCLLLDSITTLSGKVLPRLHVVRLLNNRISPLTKNDKLRYIA